MSRGANLVNAVKDTFTTGWKDETDTYPYKGETTELVLAKSGVYVLVSAKRRVLNPSKRIDVTFDEPVVQVISKTRGGNPSNVQYWKGRPISVATHAFMRAEKAASEGRGVSW